MKYAFKALNPSWARNGQGQKWLVPAKTKRNNESENFLDDVERDPTPNGLGHLLATDADNLPSETAKVWLSLELHGKTGYCILPMELAVRGQYETGDVAHWVEKI